MIIQDVLVFILPALFAALLSTRLPARLLAVDTRPRMITLLLSLVTLLCSIPAMNVIIEWNQAITFPESMSGFEQMMRQLEDNAKAVTDSLMAGATVPSLIVSVFDCRGICRVQRGNCFPGSYAAYHDVNTFERAM